MSNLFQKQIEVLHLKHREEMSQLQTEMANSHKKEEPRESRVPKRKVKKKMRAELYFEKIRKGEDTQRQRRKGHGGETRLTKGMRRNRERTAANSIRMVMCKGIKQLFARRRRNRHGSGRINMRAIVAQ